MNVIATRQRGRALLRRMTGMRAAVAGLALLTTIASAINYGSNLVFSRILTPQSFGDLTALLALAVIVAVPTGAAQTVIAARTAELHARGDTAAIRFFVRHALAHIATVSVVLGVLYVISIPVLVPLLGLQAYGPAIALIPLLVLSFFMPAAYGLLQGLERFVALGIVLIIVAASRVVFGVPWALADTGGAGGPLAGQAVGNAVALAVIFALVGRSVLLARGSGAARSGVRRRPDRRSLEVGGAFVAFAVLSNVDVLLAKLLLSPEAGGHYAALATLEKVMLFLPGAISLAIVPEAARARLGDGGTGRVLRRGALSVLAASAVVAVPAAAVPSLTLRVMFGEKYVDAAGGVLPIVIAGTGLALLYLVIVHAVAVEDGRLRRILVAGLGLQILVIGLAHSSVTMVAAAQACVVVAILAANELWGHPMLRPRAQLPT